MSTRRCNNTTVSASTNNHITDLPLDYDPNGMWGLNYFASSKPLQHANGTDASFGRLILPQTLDDLGEQINKTAQTIVSRRSQSVSAT